MWQCGVEVDREIEQLQCSLYFVHNATHRITNDPHATVWRQLGIPLGFSRSDCGLSREVIRDTFPPGRQPHQVTRYSLAADALGPSTVSLDPQYEIQWINVCKNVGAVLGEELVERQLDIVAVLL